jgi:hypothetical protein
MPTLLDTDTWWSSQRVQYNLWLVGAGLGAFALYCTIVWTRCPTAETFEITFFTAAFQAVGYLAAMVLANLFYFLGPVSEKILHPNNASLYRMVTYRCGVVFSVALPFLVPLSAFLFAEKCH